MEKKFHRVCPATNVLFQCRNPLLFLLILCFSSLKGFAQGNDSESLLSREGINLIPYPQEVVIKEVDFRMENPITLVLDRDASENDKFAAATLAERLLKEFSVRTHLGATVSGPSIILTRKGADKAIGSQGYSLVVSAHAITLKANNEPGLYYGVQTLLQLVQKKESSFIIKGLEIRDWPDIPSRAVHYDTKHHQDSKEYVEKFILDMAR